MKYQNWVDQDAFGSEASPGLSKLQYAAIHIFAATMANRTKLFDGDKENREKNQVIYNIAEDCWNHARTLETMFEREKGEG